MTKTTRSQKNRFILMRYIASSPSITLIPCAVSCAAASAAPFTSQFFRASTNAASEGAAVASLLAALVGGEATAAGGGEIEPELDDAAPSFVALLRRWRRGSSMAGGRSVPRLNTRFLFLF